MHDHTPCLASQKAIIHTIVEIIATQEPDQGTRKNRFFKPMVETGFPLTTMAHISLIKYLLIILIAC